jgi:hypothetical protein
MYHDAVRRVARLQNELRAAVETTHAVGSLVYTDLLYRQIDAPARRLDAALARLQSNPALRETGQYQQLVDAARGLRQSVASAQASPLFQSDQLYLDWTRRLTRFARTVDEFNSGPLFTSSQLYDNLTGISREMGALAREIRLDPRKYLGMSVF